MTPHWRPGRLAVAAGLAALAAMPLGPSQPRAVTPCDGRVVLSIADADRLLCRPSTLDALIRLCPPIAPVHPGDRVRPALVGLRCRLIPSPLGAARRLHLGERLDINRATATELTRIRGIGPRTASAIVAGRPWRRVDDLTRIRGIGPARLAAIAPRLRATPPPPLSPSSPPGASSLRRP